MTTTLIIYCVLIALASLAGGWIPIFIKLTHRRLELLVSFVAGAMLVVGLLHLLPHAVASAGGHAESVYGWALAGFLVMFFLERFFCYHHHDVPGEESHDEGHCHHSDSDSSSFASSSHRMTWSGAAVGLSLHSLMAGVALGAAMQISHSASLPGLAVFLVIFLHKPFDSLTLTTLMSIGEWSRPARHLVNNLFALMVPLGAISFFAAENLLQDNAAVLNAALAFSAGTFLCIAASDLLPELHFHSHDRLALSFAMLLGVALAVGIGILEHGSHSCDHGGHNHGQPQVEGEDPSSHAGHGCEHDHGAAPSSALPHSPAEPAEGTDDHDHASCEHEGHNHGTQDDGDQPHTHNESH